MSLLVVERDEERTEPWDASQHGLETAPTPPSPRRDTALDHLAAAADAIPALPAAVIQVIRLTNDDSAGPKEIESAVLADQALTVEVLRAANSAFYGVPRKVNSVSDAIGMLGMRTVRSIAMTMSTVDLYRAGDPRTAQQRAQLWKQASHCAVVCRAAARSTRGSDAETAFVAGLLHDLGKLILLHHMPTTYLEIWDVVRDESRPQVQVERSILGFDHSEVGGRAAERWELPIELIHGIRFHHSPDDAPADASFFPSALYVSGYCTWLYLSESDDAVDKFADADDGRAFSVLNRSLASLGLSMQDMSALLDQCKDACAEFEGLLAH